MNPYLSETLTNLSLMVICKYKNGILQKSVINYVY